MTQLQNKLKCLDGTTLKVLAMLFMLLDHMWATIALHQEWMTCAGRLAFPIFAFQVAEGYVHTHDFKKYLKRMFLFALVSEIPFNLLVGGSLIYPFHQNVMFTFCIALLLMRLIDKARARGPLCGIAAAVGGALLGYVLGFVTFVDYNGYGILMVLVFWLFRDFPFSRVLQLAAMVYINVFLIQGYSYLFVFSGREIWVPQQTFALLALIPIWLYNGKRGPGGKKFQYFCYAFYPVHMLILAVLYLYIL